MESQIDGQIIQLNHTALFVTYVEARPRFYGETLGLPAILRPDFSFPGACLRIGTDPELHLIGGRRTVPIDESARGGHFAMRAGAIGEAPNLLIAKAKGMKFCSARHSDGAQQIFFENLNGHQLEFFVGTYRNHCLSGLPCRERFWGGKWTRRRRPLFGGCFTCPIFLSDSWALAYAAFASARV